MSHVELGAYRIVQELAPDSSALCVDARGRRVVLKRLSADCLWRGQLHPNIKDRLARVRELALKDVATLQAVERIDDAAWLVWEYVDGETFEAFARAPSRTPEQLTAKARDLVLAVEALHGQGIVHGAVHGRNVIVADDGRVRLTHVSPLLYSDPAEDVQGAVRLLREVAARRGDIEPALWPWSTERDAERITLQQLGRWLAAAGQPVAAEEGRAVRAENRQLRWRSVVAAGLAAALGVGTAVLVYRTVAARNAAAKAPPVNWGRLDEGGR